jgi:holo-[acyl-carrier protein] synthase
MSEIQTWNVRFIGLADWGRQSRVLGIGVDVCEIDRLRDAIRREKDRLTRRLFTPGEAERASRSRQVGLTRAISFAVKEATSKALATGINGRVGWLDIEFDDRRPAEVTLSGGARRRALWLSRPLGHFRTHLHLWHTSETVTATVLLEGVPLMAHHL